MTKNRHLKNTHWYQAFIFTSCICAAGVQISKAETNDLLLSDDFNFDDSSLSSTESSTSWYDPFKTTLEHSQTQIPGAIQRQQSSVRLEFESAFSKGWYAKLDTRYRYFWHEDDLAAREQGAYGKNKWQQAWLQYSQDACVSKLGRQTLIWGEVEGTFAVDIITPFDYTEQLLTDYSNIRLAQDLLLGECFFENSQAQLFIIPEAKTDLYQHSRLYVPIVPNLPPIELTAAPHTEWGGRYKWLGEGFDVSLMYAKLYGNTPTLIISHSIPNVDISRFDLLGISSSIAYGRLLVKIDGSVRNKQLISQTDSTTDQADLAIGFEYTTSDNHALNGGIWATHYQDEKVAQQNTQVLTLGWSKTYLNDDLTMSLLGNWSSSPRFSSANLLGEYQWDDYWNFSLALGLSDTSKEAENLLIIPAKKSITVGVKFEY